MKKTSIILSVFICILFFVSTAVSAEQKAVKLAVASDGKTADSSVSSLAGRSPYYLIFDSNGKLIEVLDNPYKDARGGAGPSIARFLSDKGVNVIIAGSFGARMTDAMKAKGIQYYELKGSVNDAVKKVLKNDK